MKLIEEMIVEERESKFKVWQVDQNLKKEILDLLDGQDFG